ncbi:MAG: Na+/H+ antiporter NhaA [Gemmatimonadota bacterium]|nr:Na+/H+ antiporter NhaA [Gemmatimonadota bacterium]
MARAGPIDRIPLPLGLFRDFVRLEASGSIVLLAATVVAFGWANSPWTEAYTALWETKIRIGAENFALTESLLHWINDGLMAVFFFVVGLEIKRELVAGELSSPRKAALPIVAAIGGMVVPALIYVAFNAGTEQASGWGIPMATDIAFALAVLTALGRRAPTQLKVFLAALAIIDDLGAILVIALFYSHGVSVDWLLIGGGFLVVLIAFNALHVRSPLAYAIPGIALWFAFLESGVHATVAGVLAAMTIPARRRIASEEFLDRAKGILDRFEDASEFQSRRLMNAGQQEAVHDLEAVSEHVATPLTRMEHGLLPWVSFVILPLFALANAGVQVGGEGASLSLGPLTLGIVLGLIVGKQVGITLFSWIAVRLGWAALPSGTGWMRVWGTSWLAGIGFTMSLFIAGLAFGEGTDLLANSKLAILVASLISGVVGYLLLMRSTPPPAVAEPEAAPAGPEPGPGPSGAGARPSAGE